MDFTPPMMEASGRSSVLAVCWIAPHAPHGQGIVLAKSHWGSPAVKAPPETPSAAYKPPPAKRLLVFKAEQGHLFSSQHFLVWPIVKS